MADLILGAVVNTTVSKVIDLASDHINTALEWKEDLKRFRFIMKMVVGVLHDAEQKHVNGHPNDLKTWIQELRAIAEEAEDVFEEVAYADLRQKVAARRLMWKKKVSYLLFTQSSPIPLAFRLRIANKVKNLNLYLTDVNEWANRLGLQYRLAHTTSIVELSQSVRHTHSYQDSSNVIGRDLDREKIISMLTESSNDQEKLRVVTIVGMGGLGKTTLAKEVVASSEIRSYFGKIMWVCVSEKFEVQRILGEMLESLGETTREIKTIDAIIKKIRKKLGGEEEEEVGNKEKKKGETYLLILDDVWNEDGEKWEELRNSLLAIRTNDVGNKVLVTTRNKIVAEKMGTHDKHLHCLEKLEDDQCWSIVRERAFRDQSPVPPELEKIGLSIAKECGGVPLVAKVLGGILCNKRNISEWVSIQKKIGEWGSLGDEHDRVQGILKLSFDRLPVPALKQCFAFCAIFPKDSVMKKEMLIQLWMAEGYLQPFKGSSTEDVGDKCFNYLLACSLLQEEERDSIGKVKKCKMHDLIHDLAKSIADCETVVFDSEFKSTIYDAESRDKVPAQVRHLNLPDDDVPANLRNVADQLRTLLVKRDCPNNLLANLRRLRAVSFCGTDTKQLPPCFRNLKSLSFLDISGTRIKKLPRGLSKLYNLQTLRYMDCKGLKRRPKGIANLLNLRHLYFNDGRLMPANLGRLTNLQTLELFRVGKKKGFKIEELGSLGRLKGRLVIENLERVMDKWEAEKAKLQDKKDIEELKLRFYSSKSKGNHDEDVLEGLRPPSTLRLLSIIGYGGNKLPSWVSEMRNLVELEIISCKKLISIPQLERFSSLQRVTIWNCNELRRTDHGAFGSNPLLLEELKLSGCPELEYVSLFGLSSLQNLSLGSLTSLKTLNIGYCHQLEECLPSGGLSSCTALESLYIQSCKNLSCIPSLDGCTSVKMVYLQNCDQLECLPNGLSSCTTLQTLNIEDCGNLVFTPTELGVLNSLVNLVIRNCPNLRSNPTSPEQSESLISLASLKELEIYELNPAWVEAFLSSIHYLPSIQVMGLFTKDDALLPRHIQCYTALKELTISGFRVESLLQAPSHGSGKLLSLTKLEIRNCDLISIPEGLKELPSLVELFIYSCRKLRSFPAGESNFSCLTSLRRLRLGPFSEDLEEFPDLSSFPPTPNLESLWLYGWDKLTQLPPYHQIQHLVEGASSLKIWRFNSLEALPEWLGNLSSLQTLGIDLCRNLKHFPSAEAVRRLSKLHRLEISRSRQLQNRCAKDKGPEWSKISHIPNIEIDRTWIISEED